MKPFTTAISGIVGALALGTQIASAIPLLAERDDAPSVAIQSDLGPIHILYQNDLSTNASTGALLLPNSVTSDSASQICSRIGEQLFPLDPSIQGGIGSDLIDQFNYLRHAGTVGWWDTVWTAESSASSNVVAYKASRGSIRAYGQGEKLGVLCTHSAPSATVPRANPFANVQESDFGADKRISVTAGQYTLTGYRDRRSFRFLGIPFGDAPVGNKRFMYASPYTGEMNLDATSYRNACVQSTTPLGPMPMGEDCLNLNIFTPSLGSYGKKDLKPVLVAIYGGAFTSGRNSLHSYDGGNLASRSDIVVVTINYRLGALGWLASGEDLPGNAGLSDQILALKWVKAHIAAFGGDPDQITIGGESAGAESIAALIASSASKGLYRAAFMMSNPWVPWINRSVQSKYVTPAVASSLNCSVSGPDMVECLQKIQDPSLFVQGTAFNNATALITGAVSMFGGSSLFSASIQPFLPTPDGLIDDQIFYLAGNGTVPNKVPLLVGTLSGEGATFVYSLLNQTLPNVQPALEKALGALYAPSFIPTVEQSGFFNLDPANDDSVRQVVANAFTYNFFTCPTQQITNLALKTRQFPKVYLYESQSAYTDTVGALPPICKPEGNGIEACHGDDVMSVFGSLNFQDLTVSRQYLDFVQYNADAFSAFVRSGSPNPSNEYLKARGRGYTYTQKVQNSNPWKAFEEPLLESEEMNTQYLSAPNGITHGPIPHRDICEFFVQNEKLTCQTLNNSI
ncbi:related to Cholinesterase precursor [Melanopsichium pennsylvanicum]|uniref:Related to Cholinesterase n=2 Tax=Melanopsichium pennsylvanicum TaxID=63383 RepID=A0AAJ4XQU0_9BASI|nr:related to Cholinesterase precursor [Melanopsichium pennsylvanicum 4]SNX86202.1 related to Cholinesterase precursor [Melanopsichium pennsylvanicum]